MDKIKRERKSELNIQTYTQREEEGRCLREGSETFIDELQRNKKILIHFNVCTAISLDTMSNEDCLHYH